MRYSCLLIGLALMAGAAHADTACDNPRDDFDGLYCMNKIFQQADGELNANYKKLRSALDVSGGAQLKTAQQAWIAERNRKCSKRSEEGFFVNFGCAASMTIKRAQYLRDRLRECESSGCRNDLL